MKKIIVKNLMPCSITKEKEKFLFIEEGTCRVDGIPYKCLYLGNYMESCRKTIYNTIVWYNGAWHKVITSLGSGIDGKSFSISSKSIEFCQGAIPNGYEITVYDAV